MKLELTFGSSLCYCPLFKINGVDANTYDFVAQYDHESDDVEEYCCADTRCDILPYSTSVLRKYAISVEEYHEIADRLSEGLSFGSCGLCS